AEAQEVFGVEAAVARRRPLRVDEALALEEPDLGDRDVGELLAELCEHLADREMRLDLVLARAGTARVAHGFPPPPARPSTKVNTNRPIWSSTRSCRRAVSTRSWST